MKINITTGISKTGASIPCINLPPVVTCRSDAPCVKICYALRGRFRFSNVKNSLDKNYEAYKQNPELFFGQIDMYLKTNAFKHFRYHSSGDIPDETYLDYMCKTARKNKSVKFLCFTKKYEMINSYMEKHKTPGNLKIVLSNWGDFSCENPNDLPTAHIRFKETNTKTSSPFDGKANECSGYCGACVNTKNSCWNLRKGESVVFNQH